MKKDTVSAPFESIVDDSIPDSRIKIANFLPDPASRLDSMLMKCKPISDSSIPYRDLLIQLQNEKVLLDSSIN